MEMAARAADRGAMVWPSIESGYTQGVVAAVRYSKNGCCPVNSNLYPSQESAEDCKNFNRQYGNRIKAFFVPWSVEQVWQELNKTDLVLLPSRVGMGQKDVKSPNRLVESVWSGRFALASPLPAYQPFAEWIPLVDDFCAGLDWVLSHQSEIVPRIRAAQDYVSMHYSPEVIGKQWEAVIEA